MNDREREQIIKRLDKNQQQMIQNGKNYWSWIQFLNKGHESQDAFDKQVSSQLDGFLDLANQIRVLEQKVASLELAKHTHEVTTNESEVEGS